MAKQTVGTSAALLDLSAYPDLHQTGGQSLVLQSLGAGDVYVDLTNAVTTANGLKIANGTSVTLTGLDLSQPLYVIASAVSTDLRILAVG